MKIFENAGHSFTYGRTKTEVFEYDDVMHHLLLAWRICSARDVIVFPLFSVFVWTGEKDSNTLRVDAYFFLKRREKSPFAIFLERGELHNREEGEMTRKK